MSWLPLSVSDVQAVDRIANEIHTELPERIEVFTEKIGIFPPGCWKLVVDGSIAGYGVSHPWKLYSIPPLDKFLERLPDNPDCMYIHDVVVLPYARGYNAAGDYVALLKEEALRRQIYALACVSVYGTDVLWERYGFKIAGGSEMSEKLRSYGSSAKYMIARLNA
jgi:hypothetical protein